MAAVAAAAGASARRLKASAIESGVAAADIGYLAAAWPAWHQWRGGVSGGVA